MSIEQSISDRLLPKIEASLRKQAQEVARDAAHSLSRIGVLESVVGPGADIDTAVKYLMDLAEPKIKEWARAELEQAVLRAVAGSTSHIPNSDYEVFS